MPDTPPNPLPGQPTVCCRIEFYQLYGLRGWGSKFGSCATVAAVAATDPGAGPSAAVVVTECVQAKLAAGAPQTPLPPARPGD